MNDNTTLDAAIDAACKEVNIGRQNGFQEFDRTYFRAGIAKLLEGMDPGDTSDPWEDGYNAALNDLRKIAGLEVKS